MTIDECDTVSAIGTIGWFLMLVASAIRRKQYSEILLPVLFWMLIADTWAVAPAQFGESRIAVAGLWALALFPYALMVFWFARSRREEQPHDS